MLQYAERKLGYDLPVNIKILRNRELFPKKRDCAFTDGETIYLSDKMKDLPLTHQIALIAHEIAHVDYMNQKKHHTERQTDEHAERIFGFQIFYDHDDIQTTQFGKRPRPRYLPQ